MKATQQLKDEHQGVLLMLDILEEISQRLKKGQQVDLTHLNQILEFLQVFVDKCHHSKEEELLFPALEESGIPKEDGPIGMMLVEHDMGRGDIKGLREAILKYENGEGKAAGEIAKNTQKYIVLLREHIDKEDNILYMMADMHLDEVIQKRLAKEFEKVEMEKIGAGKHQQFHKLLDNLKEIYLQ